MTEVQIRFIARTPGMSLGQHAQALGLTLLDLRRQIAIFRKRASAIKLGRDKSGRS